MLDNSTLLVTGGSGSFGNALLGRVLSTGCSEIRVFSRDEKKQDDMRRYVADKRVKYYIGDVRDYDAVNAAMNGVDFVFHAAALKQVPSCEFYPMEAVKTNIIGADNVLAAALANRVRRCVLLSTDKAVYPVNAMGMSKALMEKMMLARARQGDPTESVLCATRYGNVMGSRGSVIPLFVEQILSRKPVTVTDGAMTRFLMSLTEAVELVMYAFENAMPGDIFVHKAPAATIADIATALKEMFASNSEIRHIGTRHGEKLFETLISREEMVRAESNERFFRIAADGRDLNYDKYFINGEQRVDSMQDYTSHNTTRLTVPEIVATLRHVDVVMKALNA